MKKGIRILLTFALVLTLAVPTFAREVILGGEIIGLEVRDGTITLAAFDDRTDSPCLAAGLRVGDKILKIDGKAVHTADDVRNALGSSGGTVKLEYERDGKKHTVRLTPLTTEEGPRLGVYLKNGITGIGTVTYYDPTDGSFGCLGHGVGSTSQPGMTGMVYEARLTGIRVGVSGSPGQLLGSLAGSTPLGSLEKNTSKGVFGTMIGSRTGKSIAVAEVGQVHTGEATILSSVTDGGVREYSVEIQKIYTKDSAGGRNLLVHVTDPELLALTGGIVQGMSGSPILQDGRLIGAVTHVLVNDPTTGYGILIENMLKEAA